MTAPNQSLSSDPALEILLGMGAFQIGGGPKQFGQGIDESFVKSLYSIPKFATGQGPINTFLGAVDAMKTMLGGLPLSVFHSLQPYLDGTTLGDFIDVPTSIETLLNALNIQPLILSAQAFEDWIQARVNGARDAINKVIAFFNVAVSTLAAPSLNDVISLVGDAKDLFDELVSGLDLGTVPDLATWLVALKSLVDTWVSNFETLITRVLGGAENVFPLTLPFTFDAPPTAGNLGDFLNGLVTKQELQELHDLIYNATLGNKGVQWVQDVAKADVATALHTLQGVASSATDIAQQAIASAVATEQNLESSVQAVIAQGIPAISLPAIPANLLPDIELHMSSAMQTLHDDIVNNLLGHQNPATNYTPTDSAGAIGGLAATLTSHTATLSEIQGTLNSSGGGVNVTVPISGGVLPSTFTDLGVLSGVDIAQYNAAVATSDSMNVTTVTSDSSHTTYNIIRASTDFHNYVWMRYTQLGTYASCDIGYVLAGVSTTVDSATPACSGVNNAIGFKSDTAYDFTITVNGVAAHTWTDLSHVTQIGASNRSAGFGLVVGAPPQLVSQFAFSSTAPVVGSGFRQYRASGSTIGLTSNPQIAPASFFDTNQWITSDFSYNSATNTVTVSNAGWYMASISYSFSTGASSNAWAVLFKNGSAFSNGPLIYVPGSGWGGTIQGSFLVYCSAGDTLSAGIAWGAGSNFSIGGDVTGAYAYFAVSLANCGTIS